jgi:hypothetical protein
MKRDPEETILEYWRSPSGAGDPIGCLTTTFTFDAGFFEEECLARYLDVDSLPDREGLAYLLEKENRLGAIYAGVLVDQHYAGVDHSMRWDILPVRISNGLQHAKISILAWVNHIRVLVASANLTPQGYRRSQEVAGASTFLPKGSDKREFHLCCSFFENLLRFVPGDPDDPVKQRALSFINEVRDRVDSWEDKNRRKGGLHRHFVFTMPADTERESISKKGAERQSAIASCLEKCRRYGPAPAKVSVASPFFDPEGDNHHDEATSALCKCMGRMITKYLTLCVPAFGPQEDNSLRLAAPISLFKTGKKRADQVIVEVLPNADKDHNQRPWHAKMLKLETQAYSALMIGSSNFTQAGLGLKDHCNVEANLLFVTLNKSYSREPGELAECWPQTKTVPNPDEVEWTGEPYMIEEDSEADKPLVPQGFVSAHYRAGERPKIILCFLPRKLPASWRVLGGHQNDRILLDSKSFSAEGKESAVETSWDFDYAPSKLLVSWEDKQAFWTVNVEDQGSLPVPEDMASMSAYDLMTILAASDASIAFRAWCRHRGLLEEDDQLDYALPAELDPLKRFDIRETFLQRIRRQARMMASVRGNLERPAWSLKSLDWRLRGILGIERLAERMVKEIETGGGNRGEPVLVLADFLLTLTEANYKEEPGWLSRSDFDQIFKPFVKELAFGLNSRIDFLKSKLPLEIQAFFMEVYDRCQE